MRFSIVDRWSFSGGAQKYGFGQCAFDLKATIRPCMAFIAGV
jgi:hypothetical protein